MDEVVRIMSSLYRFFHGHDEPLVYESDDSYGNLNTFADSNHLFNT